MKVFQDRFHWLWTHFCLCWGIQIKCTTQLLFKLNASNPDFQRLILTMRLWSSNFSLDLTSTTSTQSYYFQASLQIQPHFEQGTTIHYPYSYIKLFIQLNEYKSQYPQDSQTRWPNLSKGNPYLLKQYLYRKDRRIFPQQSWNR